MANVRGLEERHEQNQQNLIRDTRTIGQRIGDFFHNPITSSFTLMLLGISGFFVSGLVDIILLVGCGIFIYTYTHKAKLPFRMPMHAKLPDYNDPKPGSNKPNQARGIYFFGNERKSELELWFNNDDMRTHVLIFGSTGSGKTEALVSLAYNSLLQASGFIYIDGKGDNSLFAKVFSMVRSMGREDDMLLINFMTGARDIIGPQKKRLSNTMNPFCMGSSSMLSQLVVSLMDSSSKSSDGDMWKGRAIGFVEALMRVLVAMRDAGHILLDANTVRNYFTLDRLEAMTIDKLFIRDGGLEPINLENLPPIVLEPIYNYVINLPGYNKEKKGKQVSQVLEQHGFITMQLTRVFTSLADTYGHILRTNLAEVDLKDVVLNRRILTVLLPALEKSPDELSNLGKVIIASLKAMMAAGLGDEVEGEYRDLIHRKPTNAPTPYLCILDEYGYYAVQGFAVVPAQARSLGFSVVFAGQDLPAFQKASKEEAASIGANTNIKICMKLEDPMETWDFFSKTAGEAYVTHTSGFQVNDQSLSNAYLDTRGASLEKRARVDLRDLKDQREGEAHIFFKSKIVRAKLFYANPTPVKAMRLNQFLKVEKPLDNDIKKLLKGFELFKEISRTEDLFHNIQPIDGDVKLAIEKIISERPKLPIERGVSALLALRETVSAQQQEESEFQVLDDQLNIFTPLRLSSYLRGQLLTDNIERFSQPLLANIPTREQFTYIERMLGKTDQKAKTIAKELSLDLSQATLYPPEISDIPTAAELAQLVDDVIDHIVLKKSALDDDDDDDDLLF